MKKNRPDTIIGFSITNGLIGLILAKIFRIPYIFYYIDLLHTLVPITYAQDFARFISRFLFKKSDRVIVVTKFLHKYVLSEGVSPEKVKILLNGISLENTIIDNDRLKNFKSKLSIEDSDFVI
ncbi:MAG: glycosyltransferase, partial [Promethearchaeota archaeon]